MKRRVVSVAAWFAVIAATSSVVGRLVTAGPIGHVVARDVDTPVRNFVTAHDTDTLHHLFAHLSVFGTAFVTGALAVVAGAAGALRSHRPAIALQCAAAFLGAVLLTIIVKFGVNRAPASGPIPAFAAGTFPSGHALFAVCVYGTIAALVVRSDAPAIVTVPAAVLLTALALVVGWSRIFLLDHYASDVVGSVLIGSAWVAVVVGAEGAK